MTTHNAANSLANDFLSSVKCAFNSEELSAVLSISFDELLKTANSPDNEFEQSFFQLAYEKIQEKLFNLLPFLVGFEIVNKNNEGTKALGVFGFKSNNGQTIFVPAFFINGAVKGLELMYSKNNEQFYPLNEDFAELFLKDEVTGLGTPSKEQKNQINSSMYQGNLQGLVRPPQVGKVASVKHTSLLDFVSENNNLVKEAFFSLLAAHEPFLESVLRFYPLEKVAEALAPAASPQPTLKKTDLELITTEKQAEQLTEEQKITFLKQGYFILDNRPKDKKSSFGLFKYSEAFSNPTETGFYSYVTKTGNLRNALIIIKPKTFRKYRNYPKAIIIDLKTGDAICTDARLIYVRNKFTVAELPSLLEATEDIALAKPSFDDSYVLINEELQFSEPFKVTANYKEEHTLRTLEIDIPETAGDCCNVCQPTVKILLSKKKGNAFEFVGSQVLIPKGYKLLRLNWSKDPSLDCGLLQDVTLLLQSDAILPFTLNSNGSEYFINIGKLKRKYNNPVQAKIAMVLDFGLTESDAETLIGSLRGVDTKTGQIKLAYTGENFFSLRDPVPYTNELGQPTYGDGGSGEAYWETMPNDTPPPRDPTRQGLVNCAGPEGAADTNTSINLATQLAQSGQKSIFDTQAIATLSKYVAPQNKTMAYMPEYVSCLDKLGRMLFLLHWETKKFETMYGRSELPELMELLTNVFKNLGDLVIYLKRKAPELSINMSEHE